MKRLSVFILLLFSLATSFLFSADDTAQSQSIPVPVVFSPEPFVRVGFSASFVGSPVEPAEKANADSFSQLSGKNLMTKYWFMYAQSFTPEPVEVSIINASSLGDQYDWRAVFIPAEDKTEPAEDKTEMNEIRIDTATFSSQSPSVLLTETVDSDTDRPRSYCWRFSATLYKLPPKNPGGSLSGSFTVKIASVS